ncbi:hypothetical protein M0813_15988 [Anaeramoeba flamelloides]|uniref:Uncharacterized protein n=1 Tax=Anaeramoeba flamelloides TaxID=1746091 RepID=A0ABQ8Z0V2_9EUKA|nr:hypothetical protein M0813_15988 [Anaeramoeba flamelloides]
MTNKNKKTIFTGFSYLTNTIFTLNNKKCSIEFWTSKTHKILRVNFLNEHKYYMQKFEGSLNYEKSEKIGKVIKNNPETIEHDKKEDLIIISLLQNYVLLPDETDQFSDFEMKNLKNSLKNLNSRLEFLEKNLNYVPQSAELEGNFIIKVTKRFKSNVGYCFSELIEIKKFKWVNHVTDVSDHWLTEIQVDSPNLKLVMWNKAHTFNFEKSRVYIAEISNHAIMVEILSIN